jgi:hypothetical protein
LVGVDALYSLQHLGHISLFRSGEGVGGYGIEEHRAATGLCGLRVVILAADKE